MILHTVPVPGRDGDTLRDIYSDVHGDIPVARRVYHKVADEIVKRCNAYEQLSANPRAAIANPLIIYERDHPISSRTIHKSIASQWKAAGWAVTPDPDGD